MYLVICSPTNLRSRTATYVDQVLSAELDWNLLAFLPLDSSSLSSRTFLIDFVSRQCVLWRTIPIDGSSPASASDWFAIYKSIITTYDIWVFDLNPVCSVDNVELIAGALADLGCSIGISMGSPRSSELGST